jgi:hypothetical protein
MRLYTADPVRHLVTFLLFLCVCFQAASPAAARTPAHADAENLGHAVMHWTLEAHHHHDDGSTSVDDSDESARHVLADAAVSGVGLVPPAAWQVGSVPDAMPASPRALVLPAPHPERLRRPPRSPA